MAWGHSEAAKFQPIKMINIKPYLLTLDVVKSSKTMVETSYTSWMAWWVYRAQQRSKKHFFNDKPLKIELLWMPVFLLKCICYFWTHILMNSANSCFNHRISTEKLHSTNQSHGKQQSAPKEIFSSTHSHEALQIAFL